MDKTTLDLVERIRSIHRSNPLTFVGIDGCGGAGKSTLADKIRDQINDVTVVHMDEFDLPYKERKNLPPEKKAVGADTDWKRLIEQVILPLRQQRKSRYQRYSWDNDRMEDWVEIIPKGIVIIEGVYAIRSELASYYDLRVWVECPSKVRLERGLQRDGKEARKRWIFDWIPMEERYLARDNPKQRADAIIHTV